MVRNRSYGFKKVAFLLHIGYLLLLLSFSSLGENTMKTDEKLDESRMSLNGETNNSLSTITSGLLNKLCDIVGFSDTAVIFLARKLIPQEARDSFKEVYGHLNPTFFFTFNIVLGIALIYMVFKFTVFGTEDKMTKQFEDALVTTKSKLLEVEKDALTMTQELCFLEEKLNERVKEEDHMKLEQEEVKIKVDEVMEERNELRKESKKLEAKVSEDVLKLTELRTQRGVICKQNESLRSEVAHLKKNEEAMKDEVKEKQKGVDKILLRETKLKEQLNKAMFQLSNLQQEKEKVSEKLKKLNERTCELETEEGDLHKKDSETSLQLVQFGQENALLKQCIMNWVNIEGELNFHDGETDLACDDEREKILDFFDTMESKLKVGKDELESLKIAIAAEQSEKRLLEDEIQKTRQECVQLVDSHKTAEKLSRTASIKLEVLSNHFKERERELTLKLRELEEKDYQTLDGCQLNEERVDQLTKLAHHHKIGVDVLQKEIQMAESSYKEKIMILEKKAHESWSACRKAENDTKNVQQEIDTLRAQLLDAKQALKKAEEKHNGLLTKRMPLFQPRPLMPFPRPPMLHPFPPSSHSFLPAFRASDQENISLRSTPLSHTERPPPPALSRTYHGN